MMTTTNTTDTNTTATDNRVLAARIREMFAAAVTFQTWALAWATDLALNAPSLDARLLGVEAMAAAGADREAMLAACTAFRLAVGIDSGWDMEEYRRMIGAVDAPLPTPTTDAHDLPLGCWGDRLDAARVCPCSAGAARRFARSVRPSGETAYALAIA